MRPGGAVRATSERQKVIALDTNIFLYHFEENRAYAAFTDKPFEKIESGRLRAATSVLTLHEILAGVKRAENKEPVSLYRDLLGSFPTMRSSSAPQSTKARKASSPTTKPCAASGKSG